MSLNDDVLRQSRKLEHIKHSLATGDGPQSNGFSDVHLVHNSLVKYDFADVKLVTKLDKLELQHPIIINALTGGDNNVLEINKKLALAAKKTQSAMAVGSQYAAINNPAVQDSFTIVRKTNPDGIIFANIGAYASVEEAKTAVAMLDAQALQIHLNLAQELAMQEGDRRFKNWLNNIKDIVEKVNVPVIVKETGCGMAMEQAQELLACGVKIIDVSGAGGSNFIAIETARYANNYEDFSAWGINTAISTLETRQMVGNDVAIVVSGGVRSALDIVKALACGGSAVGIALLFLRILQENSDEDALALKIDALLETSKKLMLLAGCSDVTQLQTKPIIITGFVKEWLEARGIDIARLNNSRGN